MKKIYNNSYLLISIYIIFSFLIDILTNVTLTYTLSVGMILRGLFLGYLLIGMIVKYNNKENLYIIFITTLFSIIYLLLHLNITSLSLILKYDLFIILALFLLNMYKNEDKKINRNIITISLILYSLTIIIYFLINHFMFDKTLIEMNYENIFHAMGEINVLISIIVPYLIINLEKRKNFIEIFAIIIALFASVLIGTRLTVVTFLASLLYLLVKKFKKDAKNKKINYTDLIIFILFIFTFVYKFNKTPLYTNLMKSIDKSNINTPWDAITSFKLFDSFVFNGRLTYLKLMSHKMMSFNLINKLFGFKCFYNLIHMDLFDILLTFGIFLFIIFIFINTYIFRQIKTRKNIEYFPILIIGIISIFYGHTILSPSVSVIAIVIIFNLLYKKRRSKILIASNDLALGDAPNALFNFINKINNNDNEITLFLEDKKGKLIKQLPKDVIVKKHKVFKTRFILINKLFNNINNLKYLMTNFKEYDNSICFKTENLSSNYLARYASNNQIIYVHNDYTYLYRSDVTKVNKFFGKRKLDKYKHIVFVSNEAKDNFIALYPRFTEKAIVINNFIDNERILSLSKEKIKESKPKGKTLLVYAGAIDNEKKNFNKMINALSIVKETNDKFMLWIIGSGPDEKLLKEYIKEYNMEDNIKYLGYKDNYYPYILKSDYVLLTSNYEGFPVLFTDAITLEKKIITTISVTDEAISIPKNFGYVIRNNNDEVAKSILNILNEDHLKYKKIDINEINDNKTKLLSSILK